LETSSGVYTLSLQQDGKIIVGGYFTSNNGISRNSIARLNPDGSLDNTFDPGLGFNGLVYSLFLQQDGKIIVGGYFTSYNGITRNMIARLNSDGSLDNTFDPGLGFNYQVQSLSPQRDGKIIVGGSFTSYNGISRNKIVRLNLDGSLDNTFDPGLGFEVGVVVYSLFPQQDGKIIVGGDFYTYKGISRNRIARLNPDGSLDNTFDPGSGFIGVVFNLFSQQDGKIIVGGYFTSYNGITRNMIARLNSDGSLDNTFDPGSGFDDAVYSLFPQQDGKIIVGGDFTSFNGLVGNRILRIIPIPCNGLPKTYKSSVTTCDNSNYISPSGNVYNQEGTFNEILYFGCDSIVDLTITVGPSIFSSVTAYMCGGIPYTWNNQIYTQPGTYTQKFTNNNGCDSIVSLNLIGATNNFSLGFSSSQQLFTVPPFALQFSNTTTSNAGTILVPSIYSYIWDFGDGTTLASNNATVFHEYLYNGKYTVSLIATENKTGCSDTIIKSDYIFCTGGISSASLTEVTMSGIKVYPNPTNDVLFIKNENFQVKDEYTINILSVTGLLVYSQTITSEQSEISMNKIGEKGIYLAQILNKNNQVIENKKIVLE